jgi:hypothetical protein
VGENRGDEWRGWRFVVVSLAVTIACSIFFFAGRHFFPTMVERARFAWGIVTQRVTEWGGVRLKTIELQLLSDQTGENITGQTKAMQPFDALSVQLKGDLSSYVGAAFWALDLAQVKEQILETGWVRTVYLRRSFPDALKIQIVPRTPVLLARSSTQWITVDEEGAPLLASTQVPGVWLGLPMVYGLESVFDRGKTMTEMKRLASDQRNVLKDAHQLAGALKTKIGVDVESIRVRDENWTKSSLLTVRFALPKTVGELTSETKYEITFLAYDWASRVSSLQFVLSDLATKNLEQVRVLGQYQGRWIVEDLAPKSTGAQSQTIKTFKTNKKRVRGPVHRRRR